MARALELDRDGPTRRPARVAAGHQRWRELLLVHWSVPLDAVRPLVPPELELDPWDGRMWIGAVPFRMERVRARFQPRWPPFDFLELNLRTYVHHRGRLGVWFFSLDAASRLAVWTARATFGLPYFHARMRSERHGARVAYRSERAGPPAARFACEYEIGERRGPAPLGSFEHYLVERYLLYAVRRGALLVGHVHHEPYDVHDARVHALAQTLTTAARLPALDRPPETAHFAPRLDVEIFAPRAADRG